MNVLDVPYSKDNGRLKAHAPPSQEAAARAQESPAAQNSEGDQIETEPCHLFWAAHLSLNVLPREMTGLVSFFCHAQGKIGATRAFLSISMIESESLVS